MSLIISTLILPRTLTISAARLKAQSVASEPIKGRFPIHMRVCHPKSPHHLLRCQALAVSAKQDTQQCYKWLQKSSNKGEFIGMDRSHWYRRNGIGGSSPLTCSVP